MPIRTACARPAGSRHVDAAAADSVPHTYQLAPAAGACVQHLRVQKRPAGVIVGRDDLSGWRQAGRLCTRHERFMQARDYPPGMKPHLVCAALLSLPLLLLATRGLTAADAPPGGADQRGTPPASSPAPTTSPSAGPATKAVAAMRPAAAAATRPSNRAVSGTITFTRTPDGVAFVADLDGLEPDSRHAYHIHESSDLSKADLTSAGKQWRPATPHAEAHADERANGHADGHAEASAPAHGKTTSSLGVLTADAKGHAHAEGVIAGATITGGDNPIAGHAVIIHADPPPKAGDRICGGVVEVVK